VTVTLKSPATSSGRAPSAGKVGRHAAPRMRSDLRAYAAALVLVALLLPLNSSWAVQLLLVPLLLAVPGAVLLRALRVPGRAVASFPIYVPCASIVVLLGSGLAVDLLGPFLGVTAPLRATPLLVGLEATCLMLLAASVNGPADAAIPWRSLSRPIRLAWPLTLPLIAAAGSLRLNSGHGHGVALIALSASIALLAAGLTFSSRLDKALLAVILYAAELALMWSFSLRGNLVYGFDIATEYYDLHQTLLTGIWHTAQPGDAYGAMLSVTVMPAELHFLSGVSALSVLRIVYPAIGALFPVAIFGLARRMLCRRWAFAAAALFVAQVGFAQELPAIARQEVALVLFAALIAAMLDTRIPRRSQWALVALLGLAMVLSHYSTTYVAIILLALMLPLQWLISWFREIPRLTTAVAVAFVTSLVGAVIWYGPMTHSAGSGLAQLAQTVEAQGLAALPNKVPGGSLLAVYLKGNSQTPISAARYAGLVHAYYTAHKPFVAPLPDAGISQYALRNSTLPAPPVKWHAGYSALNLSALIAQQLVNVLGAIGALLIVLWRKVSVISRQIGLLTLAAVLFLAVIRLSGTLAAAYNQERALLQAAAVLSVTLCWLMQRLAGWRKWRQAGILALASISLIVLFVTASSLLGALLGGPMQTNLTNSGEDYERFYITAPELASAQWLGNAVLPGELVYADRYAQLPLVAMTGLTGLIGDVTPQTINQFAWVYADRSNVVDKQGRTLYNGHTVIYVFPANFLKANYDLVYTNGSSEVFHR